MYMPYVFYIHVVNVYKCCAPIVPLQTHKSCWPDRPLISYTMPWPIPTYIYLRNTIKKENLEINVELYYSFLQVGQPVSSGLIRFYSKIRWKKWLECSMKKLYLHGRRSGLTLDVKCLSCPGIWLVRIYVSDFN